MEPENTTHAKPWEPASLGGILARRRGPVKREADRTDRPRWRGGAAPGDGRTEAATARRLVLLAENDGDWSELRRLLDRDRVVGTIVHDAHLAALCLLHGARSSGRRTGTSERSLAIT